jgi:hypothetical protein
MNAPCLLRDLDMRKRPRRSIHASDVVGCRVELRGLRSHSALKRFVDLMNSYGVMISGMIRAAVIAIAANTTSAIRPKFHSDGQRVGGFGSIRPFTQSSLCKQRS